ncbi:DUF1648 domain-containing protein [Sphingobacterium sp.]|uniref:DUF1648 domain-containing protein n=1 Tax=Sphingobacterium sp. TaxID=341027 RepID=UPI0031D82AE5
MEERPQIQPELTLGDKILELVGYLSLFALWYLIAINYNKLPETIPVHYDAAGKADNFGGKETILALPLLATILFIGMTILNRFPHIFNYSVKITAENAFRQYTNACRLIRYLKFIIVVILAVITFKTIPNSAGTSAGLGEWFFPLTLGFIFIPVIYYVAQGFRKA